MTDILKNYVVFKMTHWMLKNFPSCRVLSSDELYITFILPLSKDFCESNVAGSNIDEKISLYLQSKLNIKVAE